jgi:hypothetical protein
LVSAATVDHRLHEILPKLELTSRDELTDAVLP